MSNLDLKLLYYKINYPTQPINTFTVWYTGGMGLSYDSKRYTFTLDNIIIQPKSFDTAWQNVTFDNPPNFYGSKNFIMTISDNTTSINSNTITILFPNNLSPSASTAIPITNLTTTPPTYTYDNLNINYSFTASWVGGIGINFIYLLDYLSIPATSITNVPINSTTTTYTATFTTIIKSSDSTMIFNIADTSVLVKSQDLYLPIPPTVKSLSQIGPFSGLNPGQTTNNTFSIKYPNTNTSRFIYQIITPTSTTIVTPTSISQGQELSNGNATYYQNLTFNAPPSLSNFSFSITPVTSNYMNSNYRGELTGNTLTINIIVPFIPLIITEVTNISLTSFTVSWTGATNATNLLFRLIHSSGKIHTYPLSVVYTSPMTLSIPPEYSGASEISILPYFAGNPGTAVKFPVNIPAPPSITPPSITPTRTPTSSTPTRTPALSSTPTRTPALSTENNGTSSSIPPTRTPTISSTPTNTPTLSTNPPDNSIIWIIVLIFIILGLIGCGIYYFKYYKKPGKETKAKTGGLFDYGE